MTKDGVKNKVWDRFCGMLPFLLVAAAGFYSVLFLITNTGMGMGVMLVLFVRMGLYNRLRNNRGDRECGWC